MIGSQIGLVVIEVNVLDILCEQLFVGRSGRWWWWRRWRRLSHRQASSRSLCSASSLRNEFVVGRLRRRYCLRTAGLNCAQALDGNVSGIRGLPSHSRRLPLLNASRGDRDGSCWSRWRRRRRRWRRYFLLTGAQHYDGAQNNNKREPLRGFALHVVSFQFVSHPARARPQLLPHPILLFACTACWKQV